MRNLMKSAFSAAAIFLGVMAAVPAHAVTFDFSVAGVGVPGDIASGQFTATQSSAGVYSVSGVSGTFDGSAITGISSYAGADNQLFFPSQPYVDFAGISFTTAGLGAINLFSNSGYFEVKSTIDLVGYYFNGSPISLTVSGIGVSAAPLPSTFSLFLGGLAAFALLGWRRKRKSASMLLAGAA